MTNMEILTQICQAITLDNIKAQQIIDLYEMDWGRFDRDSNALKELLMVMIGPSKGEIAFKIYKSRTNI